LALQHAEEAADAIAEVVRQGKSKPYPIATAHYQGTAKEVREAVKRLKEALKQVQSHVKVKRHTVMWEKRTISGR
jgi:hypothetical protein